MTGALRRVAPAVLWLAGILSTHRVPAQEIANTQKSRLRVVDARTLPDFQAEFNRSPESTQVVLLLSPT